MVRNEIAIDGVPYRWEIQHLQREYFFSYRDELHSHEEFHFILMSQGECFLRLDGGRRVHCPENSLLLINPCHRHSFLPGAQGVEHSCLIASLQTGEGSPYLRGIQTLFGGNGCEPYVLAQLSEREAMEFSQHLLRGIALRKMGDEFCMSLVLSSLVETAMRMLFREEFGYESWSERREMIAARVRSIINQKLASPDLSVEHIARQMQLHPNYLNEVFKSVESCSIGEYILRIRFCCACEMLSTNRRIKEIAESCGFSDAAYFARAFRRRFGCQPREFRRLAPGNAGHY